MRGARSLRSRRADALHVFVLTNFAIAQPLYDRLGTRAAFLVDQDIERATVVVLLLGVSIALPAFLVFLEWLIARCGRRLYESVHAIVVFTLLTLTALVSCRHLEFLLSGGTIVLLALGISIAGTVAYFAFAPLRSLVSCCAPGIVVFPLVLVFGSPVKSVLFPPAKISSKQASPVPVVLVVFDEFCGSSLMTPERQIDANRFPNFAEFSRDATWFRNATAVHPDTCHALPAILSGKYQQTESVPLPADVPQNLFSVLNATRDYECIIFEPFSNLAQDWTRAEYTRPQSLFRQAAVLADAAWRVYLFQVVPSEYWPRLPGVPRAWFGFRDSSKVDRGQRRGVFRYGWYGNRGDTFEHFLDCIGATPRPALHFAHLVLPHYPWTHLPSGRQYVTDYDGDDLLNFNVHQTFLERWGSDEWLVTQGQQRYLLQLQFVDRLVGQLVRRLKEADLYDQSLVIVTGDHGISFRSQQPRRTMTIHNAGDILSVPLFVKRPYQTVGNISDRSVESVDILPTIAECVGIRLDEPIDGWSLFDSERPEREQTSLYQGRERTPYEPTVVINSTVPGIIRSRFGDSQDADSLFQIGPATRLIGRTIDAIPQSTASAIRLDLVRYGENVGDANDSLLPCLYEGYARPPRSTGQPVVLAVAVNGTIQAVTRTYLEPGLHDRWAVMVPERAFRSGHNDVRFFEVVNSEGNFSLAACAVDRLSP